MHSSSSNPAFPTGGPGSQNQMGGWPQPPSPQGSQQGTAPRAVQSMPPMGGRPGPGSSDGLSHTFAQSMPPQAHWAASPPRSNSPHSRSGANLPQPVSSTLQSMQPLPPTSVPRTGGPGSVIQSATGTMFMGNPYASQASSQHSSPSPKSHSPKFTQAQPQPSFGTMGSMAFPPQSTSAMTPVPTPPHSGHLSGGPGGMPVPTLPPQSMGSVPSMPSQQVLGGGPDPLGYPMDGGGNPQPVPVVPAQGSGGTLRLFNGPPPEDPSKPGLSNRNLKNILWLSILTFMCVCALPALCAWQLLQDPHYRFWMGADYPYKLLVISGGSLALLVLTVWCLYNYAPRADLNEWTMGHVASVFAALTGVALLIVSLTGSANLMVTSGRLAHGCQNTMPESMLLIDYTQVLYNIRSHPACKSKMSVEECEGWSLNKYTAYARQMESDLKCGPLCADTPEFPFPAPAALLEESSAPAVTSEPKAHEREAQRRRAGSSPFRALLQVDGAAVISHKDGSNRTAERAKDEYFRVGDEVRISDDAKMVQEAFWETKYVWHPEINGMLGKTYKIVEVPAPGIIGLPAPEGVHPAQDGVWYFPVARPVKVEDLAKPMSDISMASLFSRGETRMSCLPLVSMRLKVLGWSFSDLVFWEGVGLIICSLCALGLTALSSLCTGKRG